MVYISSQQDSTYFHWQIETYLRNFESKGIDLKKCYVVMLYNGKISDRAKELQRNYEANFYFYPMRPTHRYYIASVKPYGMWKLFKEVQFSEPIFYHDADIIFHTLPDFSPLLNDDVNYMSRCLQAGGMSYVDYEYLRQFPGIIEGLIKIVGVMPKEHGGGAQYILKGVTAEYWEKVYRDGFKIYDFLKDSKTAVQVWCAEMWATLWNLWYFDLETDLHPLLDFCMSRDPIIELKPIVHNAGLMGQGYFNKLNYQNIYPPYDVQVKEDMCNFVYANEVKKIHYIRSKSNKMGKIQFIKEGASDMKTGHLYQLGELADLGEKRNANAVKGGLAVWVDSTALIEAKKELATEKATEKKEGTPKKTTTSVKGQKIETKNSGK